MLSYTYFTFAKIVSVFSLTISISYSSSSKIPLISTSSIPFVALTFSFIAYFLEFRNLKSFDPYDIVASLPGSTYDTTDE